jgi:hypothetical protein
MATHTYRYLNADDRAAVEAEVAERDAPRPATVDEALLTAWERDHYAHALLAANETDPDARQAHLDAMEQIEAAIAQAAP